MKVGPLQLASRAATSVSASTGTSGSGALGTGILAIGLAGISSSSTRKAKNCFRQLWRVATLLGARRSAASTCQASIVERLIWPTCMEWPLTFQPAHQVPASLQVGADGARAATVGLEPEPP